MTALEALEKLNHTICLNTFENLKWGIDKYENCDCSSPEEFCQCYEIIKKELEGKSKVNIKDVIDEKVVVTDFRTVKKMKKDLESISKTRKSKIKMEKVLEDTKKWKIN